MINHVKKLYKNLETLLKSYKIDIYCWKNNNLTDKNSILSDLYIKIL